MVKPSVFMIVIRACLDFRYFFHVFVQKAVLLYVNTIYNKFIVDWTKLKPSPVLRQASWLLHGESLLAILDWICFFTCMVDFIIGSPQSSIPDELS